ncbi:hypothetical protein FC62_GL001118 [Amylolactobacillus amylotrophicus DSM 20534]|uniref:Uncharacterized protein n=3 Tax=Amylolactobacillus TaxID=2767876 RepID=A0A1L6XCF3_9LACO|nr:MULTISPECIES: L,D-transpeptidase family protein [Amylolactobacillus]APT18653.1 hypothetical protein LA20533_04970 [Amylolactobacillus amylophilus DSM 20533 = JCM 1125]KRK37784.1 hypothetical protein FC62_GL001118 [Amylolactobacillus amylotrophicus DSM 20534]KRM41572.1 hypothetical protein FD40_GL001413 [Amylolactobacillus amylophilus DSM 20533 = JCM 1125]GED80802.1 hypothetical protein LAM01_12750 [Amylolactobacillus amylophilus]
MATRKSARHAARKSTKKYYFLGAVLGILAILYVGFGVFYGSHFMSGTKAYGVELSGLTQKSAEQKVKDKLANKKFVLRDKKEQVAVATAASLGIKQNYQKLISDKLAAQNPWTFNKGIEEVQAEDDTAFDQDKVNQFVNSLFPQINKNRTVTTDASIKNQNGKFTLVKEVQGNNFSEDQVRAAVSEAVQKGQSNIQLKDYYVKPKLTTKSRDLKEAITKLDKMAQVTVTYQLAGHTIQVPQSTVKTWSVYSDGKVSVNQNALGQYLASLNSQYATFGSTRSFHSTKRGVVQISTGLYGWSINIAAEAAQLTADLLATKNVSRTPAIQGSGYHKDGTDIGNTYVEVDKVNQHMWVYVDGVEQISTDVVTGKPGQDTPVGVYNVWAKQRNATLRGNNDDGTKYASPVSYWMPIDDNGVGIHDSPWQPKYGGDWYLAHGSHGCINTPPATMAKLYNIVAIGTPVIVF